MLLDPIHPAVAAYLDSLVPARDPRLAAMETEAARTDFPIIGPASGYFCYLIARLVQARSVFELGSGFGYSTAWFARAVRENGGGVVHHTVWDAELSARARQHLGAMGLSDLVEFHVGEAVGTLRDTPGPFDLVFNDIDKAGYPAALRRHPRAAAPRRRAAGGQSPVARAGPRSRPTAHPTPRASAS